MIVQLGATPRLIATPGGMGKRGLHPDLDFTTASGHQFCIPMQYISQPLLDTLFVASLATWFDLQAFAGFIEER